MLVSYFYHSSFTKSFIKYTVYKKYEYISFSQVLLTSSFNLSKAFPTLSEKKENLKKKNRHLNLKMENHVSNILSLQKVYECVFTIWQIGSGIKPLEKHP